MREVCCVQGFASTGIVQCKFASNLFHNEGPIPRMQAILSTVLGASLQGAEHPCSLTACSHKALSLYLRRLGLQLAFLGIPPVLCGLGGAPQPAQNLMILAVERPFHELVRASPHPGTSLHALPIPHQQGMSLSYRPCSSRLSSEACTWCGVQAPPRPNGIWFSKGFCRRLACCACLVWAD